MAKRKKGSSGVLLIGLAGLAIAAMATTKKAKAQAAEVLDDENEPPQLSQGEQDDDDDASPGWPQPAQQQPPMVQQPVQQMPPVVQLPPLNTPYPMPQPIPGPPPLGTAPIPAIPIPNFPPIAQGPLPGLPQVQLPTSVPVPVTLPQDADDDEAPTPANVPVPPIVTIPRPPQHEAEEPTPVSEDTALLVKRLLDQEALPNWKKKDPVVTAWQKARNLVADGQFGPTTALMVADEMGTVPLVRFWPKGSYPGSKHLGEYQAELHAKANTATGPRKAQLRAAADREQGQGFARNVAPAKQLISLEVA